jgi:hypothetical protein
VVKIKNSQETTLTFEGYGIEKKKETEKISPPKEITKPEEILPETITPPENLIEEKPLQAIKLNSKDIKNNNSIQESNKDSTEKYAKGGIIVLCSVLLGLLFLKRRKNGLE